MRPPSLCHAFSFTKTSPHFHFSTIPRRLTLPILLNTARNRRYATHSLSPSPFDTTTDVLIVGTGATALTASLRAHSHGLRTLTVEKSSKFGGASAYSGGAVWIPNYHISLAAGTPDTFEDGLKYVEAVIAEGAPESSRERKVAFLKNGPEMVKYLEGLGFKWRASVGYSDYHCFSPGASVKGRSIEGALFDLKKLGDWRQHVLINPLMPPIWPFHNTAFLHLCEHLRL
jgi:helvolic acid biosynthesis 3-ketosteroid Delta1-dehydrogenase